MDYPDDGARKLSSPTKHDKPQELPELMLVQLDHISANPRQPRQDFDEDALAELAASIHQIGLLQPVIVRSVPNGLRPFEVVAGERRIRACQMAGLREIPVLVRRTEDDQLLREALLENLQRADLNALEEAAAYQQLIEDFGCTHEELARSVGKSRPHVTNSLRLLRLPPTVARRVAAGVISAGHARALLALPDEQSMLELAARIVAEGLSVRSVEEIVALDGGGPPAPTARRRSAGSRTTAGLEGFAEGLASRLDTRVIVTMGNKSRGRVTIEFAGVADLERIIGLLGTRDESSGDST